MSRNRHNFAAVKFKSRKQMGKLQNLDRDKMDFGKGKIGPLFRALFFPTLTAMVFNSVLTVVDGIFVGHGVGPIGLAAVNIIAPMFMVSTGIGLMFGVGASVIASIRLSENKDKAARIIMTQSFAVSLFVILLITGVSVLLPRTVAGWLGATDELMPGATAYLVNLVPGLPFLLLQCIGMMMIRLDGSPKFAMWCQVAPALINIVLDYVMVFPLGMGVAGAALATSVSCGVGGVMAVAYFVWFSGRLRFYRLKMSATSFVLTLRNTWYMVKIGFATFLSECAMSVMMITGNFVFLGRMGEDGVAAFSIACYLFPIVFSISNAVAQSAQPIISYNYGLHDHVRTKRALRVALATAVVCGLIVTCLLCFGDEIIVGAFLSKTTPAFALASHGLPQFAVCAAFFAVNITFIGYYQSIEAAGISTALTLLRGIVLLVPLFLTLPVWLGDDGAWFAIPAAEMLTFVVILLTWKIKKTKR